MERESDENSDRPGRRHGREHDPVGNDPASELELEGEAVPLEDVAGAPAENAAVNDV